MRIRSEFLLNSFLFLFFTSCAIATGQAITRVQSAHSYPGVQATFAGNNTAGNAIVVMASWSGTTETPTISDTRGNTYTALPRFTGSGQGEGEPVAMVVWYALNIAAGANTVTVSGSGSDTGVTAVEYSGVATSAAVGITSTKSDFGGTATTAPASNSFTPGAGSLLFVAFNDETNTETQSSMAAGSGYTLIQGDGQHIDVEEDNLNSSAVSQTASINVGLASSAWIMYVVELLPVGAVSSPPPVGTVLWTNSGDGSGFASIVPAVPSATGVADVFGLQNDGTVAAINSDGTTAWTLPVPSAAASNGSPAWTNATAIPDFQGGLVVYDSLANGGNGSITKVDGITGQAAYRYTPSTYLFYNLSAVHTDGTIFTVQQQYNSSDCYVIGLDPTGNQKFTITLSANNGADWISPGQIIIAGDGYAYLAYQQTDFTPNPTLVHLMVLRVDTSGGHAIIDVNDVVPPPGVPPVGYGASMITNADTGIAITWELFSYFPPGSDSVRHRGVAGPIPMDIFPPINNTYGMAIVTGTSVSTSGAPTVAGQYGWVVPVLQREDGTFVGKAQIGPPPADGSNPQYNMVAFDASGSVLWSVTNDTPNIATAGGGVIGKSGATYDQNGNVTGQSYLNVNQMPGWLGNVLGTAYSVQTGAVVSTVAPNTDYATTFAAFEGGNASNTAAAIQQVITKLPQTGSKQLPNLSGPVACYPPFSLTPTCGNINAIELLTSATPDSIFQNIIQTFAPVSAGVLSNTVMRFTGPGNNNTINVTGTGQLLTITLLEFPKLTFSVMTERFDPSARTISVVTLAGHPLAGWRYWRVYSIGTNDVVVETGAYDQPAPGPVNYVGYYIAKRAVKRGWQQYLEAIKAQLNAPQGPNLQNSLGGIPLRSLPAGNGPLLNGYWDYFGDFTSYILNNVCQSSACN